MGEVRRPATRYFGGKWKLAPWIISHFPVHRVYTEAFGGGGSVLLRKRRSYAEIYNDRWSVIVNVFRVLRDPIQSSELKRRLELTPFARDEFDACSDEVIGVMADPIERARLTILRSYAGFGSSSANAEHSTGFRANSNRSGTTPAHDWMNYPSHIEALTNRLRGVVIENRNATDVIQSHDGEETLHYVDPPYPHSTRSMRRRNANYVYEMTDDDHRELATVLHNVAGSVVLSGYPCDLYDQELYSDWERIERPAFADGARDRIEVLWIKPGIERAQGELLERLTA